MKRHEPEQLNTPDVSENYRLEDILREFGAKPEEKKPSVSGDTMAFTPIRGTLPADVRDAPMKIATPQKKERPKPQLSSDTQVLPQIDSKAATVAPEPPQKQNRTAPLPPPIRIEPPPTPHDAQAMLERCSSGLSMQKMRLILLALLTLIQLALLACKALPWSLPPVLLRNSGWFSLALAVTSILLSPETLFCGVRDLFRLRISLCTLALPVCALTLMHAVQTLPTLDYCPLLSLMLLSLQRMLYAKRNAMAYSLRTVCGFASPMGIYDTPQLLKGVDSLRRDSADMDDYLRRIHRPDLVTQIQCIYATALLPLSAAFAYYFSLRSSTGFVLAWLLLLLGSIPFAGAMSYARPYQALAKRLSGFGGALCGWQSARIFGGKRTIILRDEDLFPRSNITSNGMKLYSDHRADRVISYALAALDAAQSPLTELFEGLLHAQYGKHSRATAFRLYDDDGVGVEVDDGAVVLVGTLGFMRSMGVHMPEGTRVRQAVYVSINGELAGVFAIKYKPNASTRKGLRDVLANRNFSVVLATRDFLVSPELIAAKYELPTDALVFPSFCERVRLSEIDEERISEQGGLIAKDTFGAFAVTVAAGRTLRITSVLSLVLCLLVAMMGLLVCSLLIAWEAVYVASPLHMAAFQLLWSLVNGFITFLLLRF